MEFENETEKPAQKSIPRDTPRKRNTVGMADVRRLHRREGGAPMPVKKWAATVGIHSIKRSTERMNATPRVQALLNRSK